MTAQTLKRRQLRTQRKKTELKAERTKKHFLNYAKNVAKSFTKFTRLDKQTVEQMDFINGMTNWQRHQMHKTHKRGTIMSLEDVKKFASMSRRRVNV